MIITSSQQLEDSANPMDSINVKDFEKITLMFGSFVCIVKNKKLNYLNFLKEIVEDKKTQKIYFKLLGEDNLHEVIKMYLNSTPNFYKKIFRSKLNKK